MGQLGSLLPHVVVPSVLAAFLIPEWQLTGAQAGLLAGSGAAEYMLAVPVLATMTDRIDARKILIAGSALSAIATFLFGVFADGLWSGAFFNALAGVGFAGAYMPGLKALTDRLSQGESSRAITLYTSTSPGRRRAVMSTTLWSGLCTVGAVVGRMVASIVDD